MIDYLSLSIFKVPDYEYLSLHGDLCEDKNRRFIYKEMYCLDKNVNLFCRPHKFGDETNYGIPYSMVVINPKHFESFNSLWMFLCLIFNSPDLMPDMFNVTRVDVAADIRGLAIESLLPVLRVKRILSGNFSIHKGSTIYAGSNPKVRIYDKVKEIKYRLKEGGDITDYEKELLMSGDVFTRFEIEARPVRTNLKALLDLNNKKALVSYFDRLEVFNYPGNEESGVMQFMYKHLKAKALKKLEEYKDRSLLDEVKNQFLVSLNNWLKPAEEPF